jgi:large subunit ribosomal protein L15
MNLSSLPKIVSKKQKRVGRGMGSGVGSHTTGRGNKGQKARERVHIMFEGTKFKKSLIKRLPYQRGKGKLKSRKVVTSKYVSKKK